MREGDRQSLNVTHENAAVHTPLHSCCAKTKSCGCCCLKELGRGRSEIVLLYLFHGRESWTMVILTFCAISCFPKSLHGPKWFINSPENKTNQKFLKNKIIEQVKKLYFWSLLMQDGSFQIIIKHTYELWVLKRPFLLVAVGVFCYLSFMTV